MYLQTALSKIQFKHGSTTEAYVEFYSLPSSVCIETGREFRLDQAANMLYEDFYTAYCLHEKHIPLEIKTFRLSEPMTSPAGFCTMYRIYQERFDGFHHVGLVTVLNGCSYTDYEWKERKLKEDSKNTHKKPWWIYKGL